MPRGNPKLTEIANRRKEHTKYLIREAVKQLENNYEMKSIKAVSEKTKEIDESNKGVSVSSFNNKSIEHIQSLMIELGIGKYEALILSASEQERSIADELLKAKKELKKQNLELKKVKDKSKKLSEKVNIITLENEELRTVIFEIEMKQKMKLNIIPTNNNI